MIFAKNANVYVIYVNVGVVDVNVYVPDAKFGIV
jgi:hypothetical protein